MIIAIAGKLKSGKDTLANCFTELGFTKVNFADNLKEMCSYAFGIPIEYFYDNVLKDTVFYGPIVITSAHIDLLNTFIAKTHQFQLSKLPHLGEQIVSPRTLMQYVGADMIRKAYCPYNAEVTLNRMHGIQDIVCADVRFRNELECLQELAADREDYLLSIYIKRTGGNGNKTETHITEHSIHESDMSIVIDNDSVISGLHIEAKELLTRHLEAVHV
jgi:hypothetical protein